MNIVFQYFDDCPNWHLTHDRLVEAVQGLGVEIEMQLVESAADAERMNFRGSPSVLINGVDPFAGDDAPAAGTLACRVYQTEDGSPTVGQLRAALH